MARHSGLAYRGAPRRVIAARGFPPKRCHNAVRVSDVADLTEASFSTFVRTHRYAVIHFWAAWNRHDQTMREMLEGQVPPDLRSRVAFGRLDIDSLQHGDICKQHKILNLPFLAFYRDGLPVNTLTGLCAVDILIQHLSQLTS